MFENSRKTSFKLVTITILVFLEGSESRFVFPGFSVKSSLEDLDVAAAEPRPVFVEVVKHPEVLQLTAEEGALGETTVSDASEKVEKILQRPVAFSYKKSVPARKRHVTELDQESDAVDYYKHLKKIEQETDGGDTNNEAQTEEETNEAQTEEETNEAQTEEETNEAQTEEETNKANLEESEEESELDEESTAKETNLYLVDGNPEATENFKNVDKEPESESYEVHESSHKSGGDSSHKKGSDGNGGGDKKNGGNDSHGKEAGGTFKSATGHEHHEEHESDHEEKGEKGYKGDHYDEKGNKGHHTKEDHDKKFEETGGSKEDSHHSDGFHAEKHHGEEGGKGSEFHEEGEHSKGHSTKGEHNIRKKEEFEKKEEFFDESDDEDEYEKDGEYFHKDDFEKGGSEKGNTKKGKEEDNHYGKEHHHEDGGHYKDVKGHKDASGHDSHHDHTNKHGKKESHSGKKKWGFKEGTGKAVDKEEAKHIKEEDTEKEAVMDRVAKKLVWYTILAAMECIQYMTRIMRGMMDPEELKLWLLFMTTTVRSNETGEYKIYLLGDYRNPYKTVSEIRKNDPVSDRNVRKRQNPKKSCDAQEYEESESQADTIDNQPNDDLVTIPMAKWTPLS
ncbi:hypothetical protein JTB14_029665 [Gonioctena quinquepunctata]|nr:hypothetical protein JTB14_029665 [Gonioctena quinquepunctata]